MIPWPISPLPDLAEVRKVSRWRNQWGRKKWGDSWTVWNSVPDEQLFRLIACTVLHRNIPFTGPGRVGASWMSSAQGFAMEFSFDGVRTWRSGYLGDALAWWLLLAAVAGDDLGLAGVPICHPNGNSGAAWPAGDIWDFFSVAWLGGPALRKPFGPLNTAAWLAAGYGSGYPPQIADPITAAEVIAGFRDGTGQFADLRSDTIPFAFYGTSAAVGDGGGLIPVY